MLGKIEVGDVIDTKADIKSATWKYCEMTNNTYKVKDTDAKRLRLICPDTDCSFSVYATPTSDAKWKIKTLNVVHTCDHHARKRARRMDAGRVAWPWRKSCTWVQFAIIFATARHTKTKSKIFGFNFNTNILNVYQGKLRIFAKYSTHDRHYKECTIVCLVIAR